MVKAIRAYLEAWLLPFGLSVLATAFVAGATSKQSTSAAGTWLLVVLAVQAALFIGFSVRLWRRLGSHAQGATRVVFFVLHSVIQAGLAAATAFASLVLFNR